MSNTDTESTPQAEHDELMGLARAGRLHPAGFGRLDELNRQLDPAGQSDSG